MPRSTPWNAFRSLFSSSARTPGRRKPRISTLVDGLTERLEDRQVLSAIATVPLPAGWEGTVEDSSTEALVAVTPSAAPVYPGVAGTWDITIQATVDGDNYGPFQGTVSITQKKGKLTGVVNVPGLPEFTLKGKLDKESLFDLSGKARFPVEVSDDRFFKVRVNLELTFAQNLQSFTGSLDRTIFGHEINGTVNGTKV